MLQQSIANTLVNAIVKRQREIIGPLAFDQARKVTGVIVSNEAVTISSPDPGGTITKLVDKYRELFGQTSVEVCRDAVKELRIDIPTKDLPSILQ